MSTASSQSSKKSRKRAQKHSKSDKDVDFLLRHLKEISTDLHRYQATRELRLPPPTSSNPPLLNKYTSNFPKYPVTGPASAQTRSTVTPSFNMGVVISSCCPGSTSNPTNGTFCLCTDLVHHTSRTCRLVERDPENSAYGRYSTCTKCFLYSGSALVLIKAKHVLEPHE